MFLICLIFVFLLQLKIVLGKKLTVVVSLAGFLYPAGVHDATDLGEALLTKYIRLAKVKHKANKRNTAKSIKSA